mgnify:CR=1 FL=1
MQFRWNSANHMDEELYRFCVELEFQLRPIITRFLISHLEKETSGDFSKFHFDVDLNAGMISISDKTPSHLRSKIATAFDREINGNVMQRFFGMDNNTASPY